MTSETRYMRSDTEVVNGHTFYKLLTTRTVSMLQTYITKDGNNAGSWGSKIWKRDTSGNETLISSGFVAQVQRSSKGSGIQSNTWACPQTSLSSTDRIVVRVYASLDGWVTNTLMGEFITGQLGATQLDSATWTIYYYTSWDYDGETSYAYYMWGSSSYDSRIGNFSWSTAPILKEVTDSFGMTDTPRANKTLAITDSFGLSDTPRANKTLVITDSFGVTDTPYRDKVLSILDSLGLTDNVYANKTLFIIDSFGLTDTPITDKVLMIDDSFGLLDSPYAHKTIVQIDAFGLSDSIICNKILSVTDSIGLTDALLSDKTLIVEDSIGLTDAQFIMKLLLLEDSMGLSDVSKVDKLVATVDEFGLSDIPLVDKEVISTDVMGLLDTVLVNKTLLVSDIIGMTDIPYLVTPPMKKVMRLLATIRFIKSYSSVIHNGKTVNRLPVIKAFTAERKTQTSKEGITTSAEESIVHIKPKYEVKVIRNGEQVYHVKRTRDLLVWRGEMVLANLLSQGAVGTDTADWKVLASENDTVPDMGDDSGNPELNEFSPLIGTPVSVSYDFTPTVKVSGGYQTISELTIRGIVVSDGSKTVRKIGIIDTVSTPNRNIIVEDSVVPFNVVLNDQIQIIYTIPMGY
jgi:hypothetical protein